MHQCELICSGDKKLDALIKKIDDYLIEFNIPDVFDFRNKQNALKRMDTTFENLCAGLEGNGTSNTKDLVAFEFFARITYLETKHKAMIKAKK